VDGRAAKPGRTAPGRLPAIGGRSPGRIGRLAGGRGIAPPTAEVKGLFPARGGRGIALAPEGGVGVAKGLFPGRGGFGAASVEGITSVAAAGGVGAIGTAGGRGSAVDGAVDPAEIPN
jgi:hypothetical protein